MPASVENELKNWPDEDQRDAAPYQDSHERDDDPPP